MMSEPQRPNPAGDFPHVGDGSQLRPTLPPRSSASVSELRHSTSTISINVLHTDPTDPTDSSVSPLLQRPVILPRSSRVSLDQSSGSLIQMSDLPAGKSDKFSGEGHYRRRASIKTPKEQLESGHLPPKSFYKTHYFFWWNLGYWRMPARHGSIFIILFLGTFLPAWYSKAGFDYVQGDPTIEPFSFNCMASTGWSFVGIDLVPFRSLTFGEAKAIDLAWNWIVGRGLQGILTLLAYRVFSDALLRVTELTPIPIDLYATIALPATKIELLWRLCKNLFKRGHWRAKMIFLWLIVTTIYLIAIPGAMDAATAYESSVNTNFVWPETGKSVKVDTLEKWKSSSSVVDVSETVCFSFNSEHYYSRPSDYLSPGVTFTNLTYEFLNAPDGMVCANSATTEGSGEWRVSTIGIIYKWTDKSLNDTWWAKFKETPFKAVEESFWPEWGFAPTNRSSFQCIVEVGSYVWGFSFEWLFLITMINSVWLWGLWILWLDCDTNSELCRKRRHLGVWRAVADLAEAMREELGPNICAYSDGDLLKALKMRPPVKYYSREGVEDEPAHLGLSTRKSGKFTIQWGIDYGKEKVP